MRRLIVSLGFALIALTDCSAPAEPPSETAKRPSTEQMSALRKSLKDSAAEVRLRAALTLGETHDAEAIVVLIDLLAELNAEQCAPVEALLTQLAGEWAPRVNSSCDDKIARKIRRDIWAAWWKNTGGEALLETLREHTLTEQRRRKIDTLLVLLGSDDFGKRQAASRELFALGRVTLLQLREAIKNKDAEVSRRAKQLVERIEREPAHRLPLAALRLLGVRKPDGAAGALLAYLPYAEDEAQTEEAINALTLLASQSGKPEPDLLRGLSDERSLVRAAAAQALARGSAEARAAVRKLLHDESPLVRLRAALALAQVGEREGVPVLINLVAELPTDQVGPAEGALYQLAGETAPALSPGAELAERKKFRDAWAAWWQVNAARADLSRLSDRPWYGYTVICDANRVYELDRHGKERWTLNVPAPIDAVVVPGDHVLVAEWGGNRVTERDLKNNIIWQKQIRTNPANVQRLPNGNTFIAMTNRGGIVEVDRAGKEVYSIDAPAANLVAAYRSPRGPIVCLLGNGQCVTMDTSGKQLKSFPTTGNSRVGGIDVLPNGYILIAQGNKVMEYDSEGRKLHEWDAVNPTTATGLPNGHVLVSSQNNSRVVEFDRAGKVVWEHSGAACYRARQR
jgi:HEAT repeat protein